MTTTTKLVPLDEAIAALDSPEANADRRKRAAKRAEALKDDDRGRVIRAAGTVELDKALSPLRRQQFPTKSEIRAAEVEAGRGVDRLVLEQCVIHLRAEDMAEVYRDPDRMEQDRIWSAYCVQVNAAAFQQGNMSDAWVARWREMVEARQDAESFGDSTAAIDDRLLRLVGVPYPTLPEAAWNAAGTLPASERQAELDRLERKYGPREPVAAAAPTKRRRVRA